MKPQKNDKGFIDQSIADLINGGDVRKSLAAMPRQERAKLKKNQERQEKRNGNRAVYDMHPDVIKAIAAIAEAEKCSASNVAEIALRLFIEAHVHLDEYREPIQHPRFDCKLVWKE